MDAHLVKPIDERRLLGLIDSLVTPSERPVEQAVPQKASWEGVVFDAALSLRSVGGDPKNLARVIELYLRATPQQLATLEEAFSRGEIDHQALRQLRNAAAPFGARPFLDVLKQFGCEEASSFSRLAEEESKLRKALQEFLSEGEI